LECDPPSGNEGNGCKPQGKGFLCLIAEGEVEEDRIRSIIIIPREEDLLHLRERNF